MLRKSFGLSVFKKSKLRVHREYDTCYDKFRPLCESHPTERLLTIPLKAVPSLSTSSLIMPFLEK